MSEQLLDGGQAGVGIEEVAGVDAVKVVGEMAATPAAMALRRRICRMASPWRWPVRSGPR